MTKTITSFVTSDTVRDLLDEIPWGKRSGIINELIIEGLKKVQQDKELLKNQQSQKSGNSHDSPMTSSNLEKSSSETEAGVKPTSTRSSRNTKSMRELLKYLSRSGGQ